MVELSGVETTTLKTIKGAIIYIKRDAIDFFLTFSTLPAINPKVIKDSIVFSRPNCYCPKQTLS